MFRQVARAVSKLQSGVHHITKRFPSSTSEIPVYAEKDGLRIEPAKHPHLQLEAHAPGPYTVLRIDTSRGDGNLRVFRYTHHVSRMIKAAKELLGEKYSASEMRKLMSAALQHGIDGFHADNDLKFDLRCLFLLTPGEPRHMTLPSGQLFLPDDLPKRPANACIVTHTGFMPPPREGPVAVVAAEGHREHAELKDSAWATQAHPLEALRQEGEEEVVMVHKGDCLEGLTSNFFAVTESGRVQTASGGVLDGTMRDLVLLAARAERIPVDEHAPRLEEAHTWQGCGISSTSRMFLPVHILRIDHKLAKRQLKHEHMPTRTHTHTHTRGEDGTISYLTAADPESVVGRLARRVKTMFPDECEPLKV